MNEIRFGAKFTIFGYGFLGRGPIFDAKKVLETQAKAQQIPVAFDEGDSRVYVYTGPDADAFTAAKTDWDKKYYPAGNPALAKVHPYLKEFREPAEKKEYRPETGFSTTHRNFELTAGVAKFDLLTLLPNMDAEMLTIPAQGK